MVLLPRLTEPRLPAAAHAELLPNICSPSGGRQKNGERGRVRRRGREGGRWRRRERKKQREGDGHTTREMDTPHRCRRTDEIEAPKKKGSECRQRLTHATAARI